MYFVQYRMFFEYNCIFYYRLRNDKDVDFVLREGTRIFCHVQVCYDMSSPKMEKREVYRIEKLIKTLFCE